MLGTVRSHDQWNTTIYSDDDRYRGVKNLRTLIFMNEDDMRERGLLKYDLIDVTSFAKDGSTRSVSGHRAIPYSRCGGPPSLHANSKVNRKFGAQAPLNLVFIPGFGI